MAVAYISKSLSINPLMANRQVAIAATICTLGSGPPFNAV